MYVDVPTGDGGQPDVYKLADLVGRPESDNTYRLAKCGGLAGWEGLISDLAALVAIDQTEQQRLVAALVTNDQSEQQRIGPGLGRHLRKENLNQPAWGVSLTDLIDLLRTG